MALIAAALFATAPRGAAADPDPHPTAERRLPTVVNAPGAWSDDVNAPGPVAAVGLASRITPVGVQDEREELAYFATSALDGSSSWLELPGFDRERTDFVGGVAVSPDGRWLGWVRAAKGQTIKGWSIRDTTTGKVRNLDVGGRPRLRSTMADLAFSGDSHHLLTSFETPDKPKRGRRNHEFVAWSVKDGTPVTLEEPGFYWLPNLGSSDRGVVWSRNNKVFHADPETGRRDAVALPRSVMVASWAPDDAAFAYIGRDKTKKGEPADERLYVGATASTATRVVDLPDTSPIGGMLAWRDSTHVVVGNFRRDAYVVDITDGSVETLDMGGSGDQINDPLLATDLWTKPLREPVAPTATNDPRRLGRWVGLVLFVVLLGAGAAGLRRVDRTAKRSLPEAQTEPAGQSVDDNDTQPADDRLPTIAWTLAWLFLAEQVANLMVRGMNASFPWVVLSMMLTVLVVRWVADGVLRARTVRLVLVWILLSAAVSLSLVALLIDAAGLTAGELVTFGFTLAQLVTLAVFCTTTWFKDRRVRPNVSRAVLAPLLLIAVVTALLGALTAGPSGDDATSMHLRIGL